MLPGNPLEFMVAFLPGESRKLSRTGVQIHNLQYWDDALEPLIGKVKFLMVHYDPRDITYVYVRLPVGVVVKAAVTTPDVPAVSLAEWEARRAHERSLARNPELVARADASLRRSDMLVSLAKSSRKVQRRKATQVAGDFFRDEPTPSITTVTDSSFSPESDKQKVTPFLSAQRKIYSIEGNDYD